MATFEIALHTNDRDEGEGRKDTEEDGVVEYGMAVCERVMRLLVKFLDEVDRPHRAHGNLQYPSDELELQVWLQRFRITTGMSPSLQRIAPDVNRYHSSSAGRWLA